MSLVLENPDLTASHGLAKPSDVIHRDPGILTPMVDDNVPGDVHVTEANRLVAFQAHQQVNCRVGIAGSQFPDLVRQAIIIIGLALTLVGDPCILPGDVPFLVARLVGYTWSSDVL